MPGGSISGAAPHIPQTISPTSAHALTQDTVVQGLTRFFGHTVAWNPTAREVHSSVLQGAQQASQRPFIDSSLAAAAKRLQIAISGTEHESAEQNAYITLCAMDTLRNQRDLPEATQLAVSHADLSLANMEFATQMLADEIPLGGPEIQSTKDDLQEIKWKLSENLDTLRDTEEGAIPENLRQTLIAGLQKQIENIDRRMAYLDQFTHSDPLSQAAVGNARSLWMDAATRVVDKGIQHLQAQGEWESAQELQQFRDQLDIDSFNETANLSTTERETDLDTKILQQPEQIKRALQAKFEQFGLSQVDEFKPETLAKTLNQAHIKALNEGQDWLPVETQIQFTRDGVPHNYSSTIVPASGLGGAFDSIYEPRTGVCCQTTTEATHAVNLASSELRDDSGKVLFKGLRHGIHSAYGIEDAQVRGTANLSRARETVLASLVSNPALYERALNGEVVDLDMTSISLVTPDALRTLGKSAGNERRQLQDQLTAWNQVNQDAPLSFTVRDDYGHMKTIRVRPNVIALNFGVNEGAVAELSTSSWSSFKKSVKAVFVKAITFGAWSSVNQTNQRGLQSLLGDNLGNGADPGGAVGRYLARGDVSPKDKAIVQKLASQVREIWNSGAYKSEGHDPYKMVSRLAVLTHAIGGTPLWNCKSGKDRTGMLDVEAKHLASQIALTGDVPPYGQELTTEGKDSYRQFALHTGNLEMQRLNTGLAGFKTGNVMSIHDRLGNALASLFHKGGASYVKA